MCWLLCTIVIISNYYNNLYFYKFFQFIMRGFIVCYWDYYQDIVLYYEVLFIIVSASYVMPQLNL